MKLLKLILKPSGLKIVLTLLILNFILIFLFDYVLIFNHSLVNIFAGGRSLAKVYLFFIFLLVLLVLANVSIKVKNAVSIQKLLLVYLFLFGLLLNLFSYFYFIYSNNLEIKSWYIVLSGREQSSTSLLHNHVLKGLLGFGYKQMGYDHFENMDAGSVFIDSLPKVLFLLTTVVLICIFVLLLKVFFESIEKIQQHKKSLFVLAFSIITFSLLKNILDGGLLNYEAIVSFAFLIKLLWPKNLRAKYYHWLVLVIFAFSRLILYLLGFYSISGYTSETLINDVIAFWVYVLLLYTIIYIIYNPIDRKAKLIITLATLVVFFGIYNDLTIIGYRLTKVSSDQTAILAAYEEIESEDYQEYALIGDLHFYIVSPNNAKSVGEILDKYNITDNFYPMSFPYRNCFPNAPREVYEYNIYLDSKLDSYSWQEFGVYLETELVSSNSNNYKYFVRMHVNSCLPRIINVVNEVWLSRGYDFFIISNITNTGYEFN